MSPRPQPQRGELTPHGGGWNMARQRQDHVPIPEPQNGALFGARVFVEVTKL